MNPATEREFKFPGLSPDKWITINLADLCVGLDVLNWTVAGELDRAERGEEWDMGGEG